MKKNKNLNISHGIAIMVAVIVSLRFMSYFNKSLGLSDLWSTIVGMFIGGFIGGMGVFLINYFSSRLAQRKQNKAKKIW